MSTRPGLALALVLSFASSDCSADDEPAGDADADADADGDAGPACGLDCSGLHRERPWDEQQALPTCEDAGTYSRPPETGDLERDAEDRVVAWAVTLRYENNHQFVVRYRVESFCPDGTIESLTVDAESFDPMGTWSCNQFFICL